MPVRKTLFLSVFLTAALLSFAETTLSLNTHVKVVSLQEASSPQIYEDALIFSSDLKARFVGVAFAHERFATVHPMRRNQHGIFFLVYPLPVKTRQITYRIVADGQWGRDPENPEKSLDPASGVTVSLLRVPYIEDESPGLYSILGPDGKTARFRYRAEPGLLVTVSGSFNDWDPFMYEMEEREPGLYELELPLPSGTQRYAFVDRGRKVADPLNPDSAYSPEGIRVSVLQVP